ncbi:hypothetical protein [Noviherbaspirillum autotrophicum]|uniref:hypothetical protein n=1 Tax=Noviherbaspirillum autotrophicum TaxID=709839 RepID=UPI0012FD3949|nr:hypothetical protein [Noviherbaspirillum autotrophicum]
MAVAVPEELEDVLLEFVSDPVACATTGDAVAEAAVLVVSAAPLPEPPPHAEINTAAQAQVKVVIEKR